MVEYMRSSVAFAVIFGNIIIASLNIFFSIRAMDWNPYYYRNLFETKEPLLERNRNYFIKDILEKEIETPKELRNLAPANLRLGLLIIDAFSFLFILVLIMSFCVAENECCTNDDNVQEVWNCNGRCLCCVQCGWSYFGKCSDDDSRDTCLLFVRIVFIPFVCVFIWIYLAVDSCGKHKARMSSVIIIMLIDVALIVLSFLSGFDTYCILIAVFSFVSLICNFLSILLPNLANCQQFAYYDGHSTFIDEQPDENITLGEIAYPGPEEVNQDTINKPATPSNNEQNQGNDNDNRLSVNSLDAPLPVYLTQNNDGSNQINIPYPSPQ